MTKKIKDPTLNALKNVKKNLLQFRRDHRKGPTLEEFKLMLKQNGFSVLKEGEEVSKDREWKKV